jgi:hypothetical protein
MTLHLLRRNSRVGDAKLFFRKRKNGRRHEAERPPCENARPYALWQAQKQKGLRVRMLGLTLRGKPRSRKASM